MTKEEIKILRLKLDLTQTAFGRLVGVGLKTVQAWEAGSRQPSGAAQILLSQLKEKGYMGHA